MHTQLLVPSQVRSVAREAYVYGFPLVENYRVQHAYFVDRKHHEFKAPWNQIRNTAHVATPDDPAPAPDADTPFSHLGLDLRAEPIVLTLPFVADGRYHSVQLSDAYTFNFAYLGSRTTGNAGGRYLVAGPHWRGQTPHGINAVVHAETHFVYALFRTQLKGPTDLENVGKIQAGYRAQRLSEYLHRPPPAAVPSISFPEPLTSQEERTSLDFFNILNFVLRFCPTHATEADVMQRFATIGVGPGKFFSTDAIPDDIRRSIEAGIGDAWVEYGNGMDAIEHGELAREDLFGTRAFLNNNYVNRMIAAVDGLYSPCREEEIQSFYDVDVQGEPLTGERRYVLQFPYGQLPPVNGFWSLTMYDAVSRRLVPNPMGRYVVSSTMLPDMQSNREGGLTIHVQGEAPGRDKEANWLPTPRGQFRLGLRLYWPRPSVLNGRWQRPKLMRQV